MMLAHWLRRFDMNPSRAWLDALLVIENSFKIRTCFSNPINRLITTDDGAAWGKFIDWSGLFGRRQRQALALTSGVGKAR